MGSLSLMHEVASLMHAVRSLMLSGVSCVRSVSLMNEVVSLMQETSSSLRRHSLGHQTWIVAFRGHFACKLNELPVLCGYPIDFQSNRTYLFGHAEATPES